jgi:hypothetical protein
VPGERIELPTNGLQNRCSTAELTRHAAHIVHLSYVLESELIAALAMMRGSMPGDYPFIVIAGPGNPCRRSACFSLSATTRGRHFSMDRRVKPGGDES